MIRNRRFSLIIIGSHTFEILIKIDRGAPLRITGILVVYYDLGFPVDCISRINTANRLIKMIILDTTISSTKGSKAFGYLVDVDYRGFSRLSLLFANLSCRKYVFIRI